MKKIMFLLYGMALCNHSIDAQTPSTTLVFEERVFNFGTIQEKKGKVSHTFLFQNKGKTDATIYDVHSACGCIGKAVTKGSIKPGAKSSVVITFDPSYKSGFFSKEIAVVSNNGQEYNRIWVEGNIEPTEHPVEDDYPYNFGSGLHLRLKVMAFGYVKPGETAEMELHYANGTAKEMTLQFLPEGHTEGLKFTNPGKIAAKAKGVVKFSYKMPALATGDVKFKVYPIVDNKKVKEILVLNILNEKSATRK